MRVTHYATDLFALTDDTQVIANWHGQWRTEAFLTTVGALKSKAEQ
jgi:hypothetical protein